MSENTATQKTFMHSFKLDGANEKNVKRVTKAMEKRKKELRDQASGMNQICNFDFEIIQGMDSVRVNVFSATFSDAVKIGMYICQFTKNPHEL